MRVAAVEFSDAVFDCLESADKYLFIIQEYIAQAADNGADLVVLPGFTGCFYQLMQLREVDLQQAAAMVCHQRFIHEVMQLSQKYQLFICPGSYWERQDESIFHTACIVQAGHMLLKQRQLYLAKWEKRLKLSRGMDVVLVDIKGWKTGIMLSTDVFYPQVARKLALMGADIVLSPVGFVGNKNIRLQVSGVWQKAQLNHFFAVESGFNGELGKIHLRQVYKNQEYKKQEESIYIERGLSGSMGPKMLWGESVIHAPLPMTPKEDGILQRTYGKKDFIISDLDLKKRKQALKEFNALAQLNPEFYTRIRGLGGKSD